MDVLKPWLYIDYTNNIWKFSVNSVKELKYSIMNEDGKWTEEKLIDKDVTSYYVYVDQDSIHIVYSNRKSQLRYCTFINEQWMGKIILDLNSEKVSIENINILLIDRQVSIFYLLVDKMSNDHGILMYCKWGKKTTVDKIQDLILVPLLKEHYVVYLDEDKNAELLFLSDEGNEISINHCTYKDNQWTDSIRLYGVTGDDLEIKMLKEKNNLHILNKYKDNSAYHLEHVLFRKNGVSYKVHESINLVSEPVLVFENNKLLIIWLEENKVHSSYFNGLEWSNPDCVLEGKYIQKYNWVEFNGYRIKNREIYVIDEIEFKFLIPGQRNPEVVKKLNTIETEEKEESINHKIFLKKDSETDEIKIELENLKSINKSLEQTIIDLNTELKTNKRAQVENEDQISKMLHYKKKAEDNYNIFIEVQNKLQKELEEVKKLYTDEISKRENIEKLYEEEIIKRESIEQRLKEAENEKTSIKALSEKLKEENNRINEELTKERSGRRFWKFN